MDVSLTTNVSTVDAAFKTALKVVTENIHPRKTGLLKSEQPVLHAGLGYEGAWTRDAAINVWNAGYLFPEVSKNTLLSILEQRDSAIHISGEYWDSLLFLLGAWAYYHATRDDSFLAVAYMVSMRTMRERELNEFDLKLGLFRGPGVYNDGVSGYPEPYCTMGSNSAISEWVNQNPFHCSTKGFGLPMHVLSTNCLYYRVYRLLDRASSALKIDHPVQTNKANALRESINRKFWDEKRGHYAHIVDKFGGDDRQESLGIAFSIMFNIAPHNVLYKLLQNTHITKEGVPCLWPAYSRYKKEPDNFGRHSGIVWPFIQAFWAEVLANLQQNELFGLELLRVADRAARDQTFYESYHPNTGLPYGGLQEQNGELVNSMQLRLSPFLSPEKVLGKSGIVEWRSMPGQVWSATGYLRMVINNLVGLKFTDKVLGFKPILPSFIDVLELRGLTIGEEIYDIYIKGVGSRVDSLTIDGVQTESNWFVRPESGRHAVKIECSNNEPSETPLLSLEIQ